MNILLDTNIIIPLEDTSKILDSSFAELRKLSVEQSHCLYIHPMQLEDINRDKNQERRKIVLSRLKQYSQIENPPILSDQKCHELGLSQSNDNDKVDNNVLFALYRGAAHLLVTNDEGIHRKATKIGLQDKVYRLEQFLLLLRRYTTVPFSFDYTGVKERFLYEIDRNQLFFESLRQSYDGFDKWFQKCATDRRKCWCIEDGTGNIVAICIYKHEQDAQLTDSGVVIHGRILKLCTFKVDPKARGKKLGERLLYIAFDYCVKNKLDWVYLHTFGEEQKTLVGLCLDYGFYCLGKYKQDDVYIKPMKLMDDDYGSLDSLIRYYPYFKDNESVQNEAVSSLDVSPTKVREAIYETILSIDSIASASSDNDSPFDFIKDNHATPDETAEISELGRIIREAIAKLPQKDRTIVEYRFYRNMQVKQIAQMVGLSSSRITRIVQSSLNTVREYLEKRGLSY